MRFIAPDCEIRILPYDFPERHVFYIKTAIPQCPRHRDNLVLDFLIYKILMSYLQFSSDSVMKTDTEKCEAERDGDSENVQYCCISDESEEEWQAFLVVKGRITNWSTKNPLLEIDEEHTRLWCDAKNAKSPLRWWNYLFSSDVTELILNKNYSTNTQEREWRRGNGKNYRCGLVQEFQWLLYLARILRSNRQAL